MLKKSFLIGMVALAGAGLSACDVDKTQEGNVTMPKYEVEKTQEGSVTPPKYEVTPPEVTVTQKERTVEVPTIQMEKKTVEVPSIDIDPAKENDAARASAAVKEK